MAGGAELFAELVRDLRGSEPWIVREITDEQDPQPRHARTSTSTVRSTSNRSA
jgi:hypothetical protein